MGCHHIEAPSAELKKRVLGAAREVWITTNNELAEVSWIVPVVRLAASVAAAMFLVISANILQTRSIAEWSSATRPAVEKMTVEPDPDPGGWKHTGLTLLAEVATSLPRKNAPLELLHHLCQIRELSESGTSGAMKH